MRLALVVTGGLHPSGREQIIPALASLVEHLARDHDVHAFVLRHLSQPTTYSLHGATVHDLGRPRGLWAQWRALEAALATCGRFDVIHGYWIDPAGVLAACAGRRLNIACLVSCDSGEFISLPEMDYGLQRSWRGRAIAGLACRLATGIHVTSQYMESQARGHGHQPIAIPLGIQLQSAVPARRPREQPPWRLLQVASLNRIKDQATLLGALARARQRIDVRLDLVGEDTLGGQLQREAADLGIADAVTFHGFVPNDRLAPFHAAAHLYVQSSAHEAAGVSVLEAAAAGLPIVGTRVGYVSDWTPHAAVAVQPRAPDALADAIVQLLPHPDERRSLAARALRVVNRYDVAQTAAKLTALYHALAEAHSNGPITQ